MEDLLDCGHPPSPHSKFTTGYGATPDGRKHCYDCCDKMAVEEMKEHGKTFLYLTDSEVINWTGNLRFKVKCQRKGRHNIAGVRYDVWFNGPDGHVWHGVQFGDNTQICHCKRTRETHNASA